MKHCIAKILMPILWAFVALGLLVVFGAFSPVEMIGGALGFALEATFKTFLPLVAVWMVVDRSMGRSSDDLAHRLKR